MRGWIRRVLVAVVGLVALYVLAGSVGTALMLNYLLTPGSVNWNGSPKEKPTELGYRGDPTKAFGYAYETIKYKTEWGEAEAWMVPAEEPSELWAIYVHGIGGLREDGYKQLSILHEAGIPTLMINYRNDGAGPYAKDALFGFGAEEWRDLDAAVSWALANGASRILLAGESMGGAIVGQFLEHSDQTGKVVALALDAPALDFSAVVSDKLGARLLPLARTLGNAGIWLFDRWRGTALGKANSLEVVENFPGPVFLAHGTRDFLVPVTISDELVARRVAPTTYLRTHANHLLSYKEDPERYRQQMLAWLKGLVDEGADKQRQGDGGDHHGAEEDGGIDEIEDVHGTAPLLMARTMPGGN